jgi:hypothetical protein
MKKLLLLLPCSLMAMEIPKENIFARQELGTISASFNNEHFSVNTKEVQRAFMDENLRKVRTPSELQSLLKQSYIKINKDNQGDYHLSQEGRLQGGGPIFAAIAYIGIKIGGALPMAISSAVTKHRMKKRHRNHHEENFDSAADSIQSFSSNYHAGRPEECVVEAGTSFIVDSQGVMHNFNNNGQGDDSYMATMMVVSPQAHAGFSAAVDNFAQRAFEVISKLPTP